MSTQAETNPETSESLESAATINDPKALEHSFVSERPGNESAATSRCGKCCNGCKGDKPLGISEGICDLEHHDEIPGLLRLFGPLAPEELRTNLTAAESLRGARCQLAPTGIANSGSQPEAAKAPKHHDPENNTQSCNPRRHGESFEALHRKPRPRKLYGR